MDNSAQKIQPGNVCRVPYAVAGFGDLLLSDWAHGVPGALQFFPPRTWRDAAEEIRGRTYPRAEVSKVLEAAGRSLGAPEPSLQNARKLAEPGTLVVATGQQAGFLGGPLYSLHKALTAVALARRYEIEAGGSARFVPLFWVAGDDHDLAEIDHAHFLSTDGSFTRVDAPIDRTKFEGRSASDVHLSDDTAELARLQDELSPHLGAEFAAATLRHYHGQSLESAFAALLLEWLGHTGLVVARSSDLRRFATSVLSQNLGDFERMSRTVQEAGVAMRKASYSPGFSEKLRVAPHFFAALEPGAPRAPIHVESRGAETVFRIGQPGHAIISMRDLKEKIAASPELFSASAPLRPVLQQSIFPVAATVLGPGEMAYWAQLRAAHRDYGAPWPVIEPRATLTLLDGPGEKAVRKLGLSDSPAAIFQSRDELARRAVAGGELGAKIAERTRALLGEFDALRSDVRESGAGIDPMLEKTREKFAYELARIAEKAGAALDQRGDAKATRAAYLAGLVSPRNSPQERILSTSQFVAKHPGLVDKLLGIIESDGREHLIVTIE